ncbi:MAG: T9SS type A sorting domain-containing protein, partial [Flavobacteriaceae bacterium]|nr:T9SS type A sorting domain-containing protein [Flavobacteriaceae bacterium]
DLDQKISVTPNPTRGKFTVTGNYIEYIEMFNLFGQKIIIKKNLKNKNSMNFELNKIVSGVYILKITTNIGITSKKLIYL